MDKSLKYDGSRIHYNVTGKGDPVILLHGFAEDSRIWDGIADALSKNYLLIIPDLPGSGRSELLKTGGSSMAGYADCIKAILDAEQIDSVVMIGHSMGGYISLAFAEKYPGLLRSLGLFHSSGYADDAQKVETRKKAIGFIQEKGADAFLKTSIPGLFKDAQASEADINDLLQKGKAFSNEALVQYYEAMIARPDRTQIFKMPIPFLFIMGEHDKAVPFEHSLQQSQLPALSYVYILRNSAHMGMLEEKSRSIEILGKYLQDVYR